MSGGAGPYEAILEVDHVIDTPDAQLEFQNFVLSSAEQNLVTGRVSPPKPPPQTTAPDYGFTAPQPAAPQGQPAPQQRYGFWTIEYYSMFFDVDTSDVVQRMLNTLFPKNDFIDLIANNPDLYGPFWVATTVIFALFVTSSIAGSIVAYMDGKEYNYDFSLLSSAVGSIYTYVAVMPAIIWGVCRYFGCPLQLLQVIDVYGYGLTVWIPVSLLCVIPWEWMRWLIVLAAFALSTFFMLKNIYPIAARGNSARATTAVVAIIIIAHGALALLFKFGFFTYVYSAPIPDIVGGGDSTPSPSPSPVPSPSPSPS